MKRPIAIAALVALVPLGAAAGDLDARAEFAFENYKFGAFSSGGFRQSYALSLTQDLNNTTLLRVFARAAGYAGDGQGGTIAKLDSRQWRPGASLTVNTEKLTLVARSEYERTASGSDIGESERRRESTTGSLVWRPDGLPTVQVSGSRFVTKDDAQNVNLTNENAGLRLSYPWRGLVARGDGVYTHSADLTKGYDRRQMRRGLDVSFGKTAFGDRLSFAASASARFADISEKGLGDSGTAIPTPVTIFAASSGIDDSPSDNLDRPLLPNPLLIDGDLRTSAGISIGPDGQSFHNIALELGRPERLDEIRIVVRDELGDPLQIGGGAVEWDVWTSEDGQIWTQLTGVTTSFNGPLSLYSVTFEQVTKRWIKMVNFGVNIGETLVTEVEAYYLSAIDPGDQRKRSADDYIGLVSVSARPTTRLSLTYSGSFNSSERKTEGAIERSSTAIDHAATAQYHFVAPFTIGSSFSARQNEDERVEESSMTYSGFAKWAPTDRLRLTLDVTRQDQTAEGMPFALQTEQLIVDTRVLPTLWLQFVGGVQSETPQEGEGEGARTFLSLQSRAQLTRSIDLSLQASMNHVSTSQGYSPRFLGAGLDDRVDLGLSWRRGRALALRGQVGWYRGESRSGTTGKLRIEWQPLGDGTLVVGGFVDQDVDVAADRQATRAQIQTRWAVNRWARLEVSYTTVLSTSDSETNDRRTLFATLIVTN